MSWNCSMGTLIYAMKYAFAVNDLLNAKLVCDIHMCYFKEFTGRMVLFLFEGEGVDKENIDAYTNI